MARFSLPDFMRALFLQTPRHDRPGKRYPLRVHIATLFSVLTFFLGLSLVSFHQLQTSKLILTASQITINRSARELGNEIKHAFTPIRLTVDMLAYKRSLYQAQDLNTRLQNLPYLLDAINHSSSIAAIYIGYGNGDFFILFPLKNNPALSSAIPPPPGSIYMIGSITQNPERLYEFLFLDARLQILKKVVAERYHYFDPRLRLWFTDAQKNPGKQVMSRVYQFQASRSFGTTFARQTEQDGAVVAADLTIDSLDEILSRQDITPNSYLMLLDANRQIVASNQKVSQATRALRDTILGVDSSRQEISFQGDRWHTRYSPVQLFEDAPLQLVIAIPEKELLAGVEHIRWKSLILAAGIFAAILPIVWWLALRISRPLEEITTESSSISRFHFENTPRYRSLISEIDELAAATHSVKNTIRRFQEIGLALASEQDFDALLARILRESSGIARARGGILYLCGPSDGWLTPAQGLWDGHLIADVNRLPAISRELRNYHPVLNAFGNGTVSHIIEPIDFMTWFGALGEAHTAISALAIPLKNRQAHTVGVLLLLEEEATQSGPLAPELIALMEAISGTAAVAIETQRLIQEQKDLLEAFIQLIASAIDAKSPYTGGHCQRVPELAKLIAQAACESPHSPWTHFRLDETQWQTLHIASWLHDCGKITTPEYVVDKATKLETIYDRIHEIRTRFEVLKRDAEIAAWKAIAAGADETSTLGNLQTQQATLDEEFAFVANCNPGSEFMSPDKVARLQEIAQRTWQRTLDDTLGVSREELARKQRHPKRELPATESLLSDKNEHLIERTRFDYPDPTWQFQLKVPEYLYNRGELHNLSVARGTLSPEERYKINEHIIQTIQLLARLPLPKHLEQVPEIACGHHEKMDGTGYPLGLKHDEMSELARMMAVADIFEALTAGDRPYKPGKTLSEALEIMARMKADHHIDPEVFDLFLQSGVHLQYARRHMNPNQIDTVDVARLVAIRPRQQED